MTVIDIVETDIANYKVPSMYIVMPYCTFKCGKENCQNSNLVNNTLIDISVDEVIKRYENNKLTEAVVFGGLEPLDSINDLKEFISKFHPYYSDPIVIYTGYTEEEVTEKFSWLFLFDNIIIKYGRYIAGQKPHFDELLGVELASDNQYAKGYNLNESKS